MRNKSKRNTAERKAFGRRLKQLRDERGLSTKEVAQALGWSVGTIQSYENGRRFPENYHRQKALADFFGVPMEEMFPPGNGVNKVIINALKELEMAKQKAREKMEEAAKDPLSQDALQEVQKSTRDAKTKQEKLQKLLLETRPIKYVPLYDNVLPLGYPLNVGEDLITGWHPVPQLMDVDFAVKTKGDSLQDVGITGGDIILVNTEKTAKPGDLVVAAIDNEYTVKYLVHENGRYVLRAANSKYQDIEIPENDFRIVGVVKGIFKETPTLPRGSNNA